MVDGPYFSDPVSDSDESTVVVEEPSIDGRMTGGGSVFYGDSASGGRVRVTRGFEIHCDPNQLPNNLQVNEHANDKDKFHLDELLAGTHCTEDPNILQDPPAADFDTFVGIGIGKLNLVSGAPICFIFVDAGEPAAHIDHAYIQIWPAGTVLLQWQLDAYCTDPDPSDPTSFPAKDPASDLYVAGFVESGNFQAH